MRANKTDFGRSIKRLVCLVLVPAMACLGIPLAHADLRAPAWYDQNAVNAAPDWHYRVPINVPAGATVNSTVKVDVDFSALFAQLGGSGTLDVNSPRVVRSTGALSTNQEFTDAVYAGATDAVGNGRGEVRFILQDAGAVTYYLYFDITANGAKPVNPQVPINGNFEQGGSGTATPPGWIAPTKSDATFDAQIRPSETVSVATNPAPIAGANPRNTDGTPNTGQFSYLVGARSDADNVYPAGNPAVTFTKSIVVPATTPGSITVRWRPEGWDTSSFDTLRIDLVGSVTTDIVGPPANLAAYAVTPNSPNYGANQATATTPGYRQYNGYDCGTNGVHTGGMTITCGTEPWFTKSISLATYAGQTITLRIRTYNDANNDKTWAHVDDIEWSVVTATLGTPQAFGANITLPAAASTFSGGQTLSIQAQMDAQPTATGTPVTAEVYDQAGTLVASGIVLYNDATHGDAVANDATWSNNGSVGANPTYTIPGGVPSGSNWLLRVMARDASTSTIGATNGLIHIPAQPNTPFSQANFYNVDELSFTVNTALLTHLKTVAVTSDPYNGGTNPKYIPGAEVLYTLNVTNSGPGSVSSNTLVIVDPIPANTELFTGNLSGGAPFVFINGAPSSGLTCNFTALNNFADCVDFSAFISGSDWSYVPNGGFDSNVKRIRFSPAGSMSGDAVAGSPSPNFNLQFRVRVQ